MLLVMLVRTISALYIERQYQKCSWLMRLEKGFEVVIKGKKVWHFQSIISKLKIDGSK